MKTTIFGGILFLVPLAFVAIVLGKAFQISMLLAKPVDSVIPIESFAGVAFVNLVAIVLVALACFIAGLAAQRGWLGKRVEKLDGLLIDVMPGYAVAKGMIGSVANDEDIASVLRPVHVRFDDYDQIAFEVERNETHATLFLPGAPSAWSGSTVIVALDRVASLDAPSHEVVKLMRVLGRGSLDLQRPSP